ncbi:MAG TPA: cupin domain-containing protein [Henriciella marina]|uniref:cupin domain-containing protein n=1 Tax=Henriciella sp. TaxID=1968823 RepID=UPI0018334820|nr:cupin domain-containing protein [Henriciella sp.]HIG23609.1 cupin domain-containing protein [Henriciella sp.]HIK65173.1 cupin domain-containing protein [Henriciella marina]
MKRLLATAILLALSGQAQAHDGPQHAEHHATTPPPGSNEKLRAPIASADGLEVLISDVVIPPNATVPRHYHPGEEFLYVISGSAVHVQDGQDDIELAAGDSYVIPPRAAHSPRGGPDGARAIVFRVHRDGMPERILLEDGETPPPEDD